MIGKIVTIDSVDKYLIILNQIIDKDEFVIGVKVIDEKYSNNFKLFLVKYDKEELYLEKINDEELLKVVINNYLLSNMN